MTYRLVLTNSEVTTFRECPRRWSYRYEDGLRPPRDVDIKTSGQLFHSAMKVACLAWRAAYLKTGMPPVADDIVTAGLGGLEQAVAEETETLREECEPDHAEHLVEKLTDEVETLAFMVNRVCRQLPLESQVPLLVEQPLSASLYRGIRYEGMPDLVTADLVDRRVWVWDWKTSTYDVQQYEGRLRLDTQSAGYVSLVREHLKTAKARRSLSALIDWADEAHEHTGPFVWHVVRRKMPADPYVTRLSKKAATTEYLRELLAAQESGGGNAGMVSTARGIDTTAERYLEALQAQAERGLAVTDDQRATYDRLRAKGDTFTARTERYITPAESDMWLAELRVEARRIREARRSTDARTRNPSACSMPWSPPCAYREVCINDAPETRALFSQETTRHPELRVIK